MFAQGPSLFFSKKGFQKISFNLKNFLAEQKKFVEHLDKIIQDYKRIYQDSIFALFGRACAGYM